MAMIPLQIPPGVHANGTVFESSNRWREASLVRWHDGSMRPVGGWTTRKFAKKSFKMTAKHEYGDDRLIYRFFKDKNINSFESIQTRADAGSGWHVKNEFIYQIIQKMNSSTDVQSYMPSELYLNGEYWGIYNVMERKSSDFIRNNHGITDIDMLSDHSTIEQGDNVV